NGFIRGLSPYFRWIYQQPVEFPIPLSTPMQLAAALAVVVSLIGVNFLSTAILAGQNFLPVSSHLLRDLPPFLGVIAVNGISLGIVMAFGRIVRRFKLNKFFRAAVMCAGTAGIYQTILAIVIAGWVMLVSVVYYMSKANHVDLRTLVPQRTVSV